MERKTAVVTGGSRGMGKAIAEELAGMGYDLILVAKDADRLKKTSAEIAKKWKVKVEPFKCDLADAKEIDRFCQGLVSKNRNLDVLINNAGIYVPGSTENASLEKYDEIMSVNTRGMFYMTHKLLPLLKKGQTKRIVIISSVWALDTYPVAGYENGTIYSISKWALRGWVRSLREEVRRYNIGVTILYPGAVWTDEWEGAKTPKKSFIDPAEVGKIVGTVLSTRPETVIEEIKMVPIVGHIHG